MDGDREHFGFKDGVSQVGIRGRLSAHTRHFLTRRWIDPEEPAARLLARPGQPLVWPGQFLFGLPTQSRHDQLAPGPPTPTPDWAKNGSLLAFRRLRQDVPAFRLFTQTEATRLQALPGFAHVTRARLEAMIVGRWPDGSAVPRAPDQPDPDAVRDMLAINYFGFSAVAQPLRVSRDPGAAADALAADAAGELREVSGAEADRTGRRCPMFAHIRKVNPRDLVTDQGGGAETTLTFQMLRRGITYGPPFTEGEPAGVDRGLLFMSWQTSLENQFELLSSQWMNRTHGPEGGSGHDMLVGQAQERECVVPSEEGEPEPLHTSDRWVIPTGGGYFFGPSLRTLATIAAGPAGES